MGKNNKLCVLILGLVLVFFLGTKVDVLGAESGFTYEVEFPENQMEKDIGYYHLKMNPSQEQIVTIKLTNPGKEKVTVNVSTNGAKTNSNGLIIYGSNNIKDDDSLKFNFNDIVSAPKTIELAPSEEKDLEVQIKMPETSFDGQIAGGIQMIEANQGAKEDASGATVINEYAYVVALLLQETDTTVSPALSLNSVKAGQNNSRNTIFVNYSNVEAEYFEDMTTEVQVHKKDNATVLYERKQSKMRMAPNSQINFLVEMNGEKMEAGTYIAKILVTGSHNIREEWEKEFTITAEEANKYNQRDIGLVQEKGFNWQLVIMIVIGILIMIGMVYFIIHTTRKRNQHKKRSKKIRKK